MISTSTLRISLTHQRSEYWTFLSAIGNIQYVTEPTHQGSHILDPIITRSGDLDVLDIRCDDSVKSDHSAVIFQIPVANLQE